MKAFHKTFHKTGMIWQSFSSCRLHQMVDQPSLAVAIYNHFFCWTINISHQPSLAIPNGFDYNFNTATQTIIKQDGSNPFLISPFINQCDSFV